MIFASRQDAGRRLGQELIARGARADVVLGLPRGGVLVAAEVAHALHRPLDVLVVRKVGHPLHREFAVGALAEGGVVLLDETVIGSDAGVRAKLEDVLAEEAGRLREYRQRFLTGDGPELEGRDVLIVDDGLATGATTEAAVLSARRRGARQIGVAAPVASTQAVQRLARLADEVVVLLEDPEFQAVGRYYDEFTQTTDEEVLQILRAEHAQR